MKQKWIGDATKGMVWEKRLRIFFVPGEDYGDSYAYLWFGDDSSDKFLAVPDKRQLKKLRSWIDECLASMDKAKRTTAKRGGK